MAASSPEDSEGFERELEAYLEGDMPDSVAAEFEERVLQDPSLRESLVSALALRALASMARGENVQPSVSDPECEQARKHFAGYRKNSLEPSETAFLSRHLDSCLVCSLELEAQARLARAPLDKKPRTCPKLKLWSWAGVILAIAGGSWALFHRTKSADQPSENPASSSPVLRWPTLPIAIQDVTKEILKDDPVEGGSAILLARDQCLTVSPAFADDLRSDPVQAVLREYGWLGLPPPMSEEVGFLIAVYHQPNAPMKFRAIAIDKIARLLTKLLTPSAPSSSTLPGAEFFWRIVETSSDALEFDKGVVAIGRLRLIKANPERYIRLKSRLETMAIDTEASNYFHHLRRVPGFDAFQTDLEILEGKYPQFLAFDYFETARAALKAAQQDPVRLSRLRGILDAGKHSHGRVALLRACVPGSPITKAADQNTLRGYSVDESPYIRRQVAQFLSEHAEPRDRSLILEMQKDNASDNSVAFGLQTALRRIDQLGK